MPRGRIRKTVDPVTSLSNRLVRVYKNIVLNIIPTLYEGYIVSVHRMVMENRPVLSTFLKIVLLTLAASRGVTDLYPS